MPRFVQLPFDFDERPSKIWINVDMIETVVKADTMRPVEKGPLTRVYTTSAPAATPLEIPLEAEKVMDLISGRPPE